MVDNKHLTVDRRRFLRNAGIGASAVVGVSGTVAGKQRSNADSNVTGREVNRVLRTERVNTLLDELGNPPLQRGRAQKKPLSMGADQYTAMAIPNHLGTLLYLKRDEEEHGAAYFLFGAAKEEGRIPRGFIKRLPPEYRDLPGEDQAVVSMAAGDEPVLYRGGRPAAESPTQDSPGFTIQNHLEKYTEIVERHDTFTRTIGSCDAYSSYSHTYEGISLELQTDVDNVGKTTLAAIIGALASSVVSAGAGALALAVIALGTSSHEYTVGVREYDHTFFGHTQTFFQRVVAGDYRADLHYTVPAGYPIPGHPYR